MRKGSAGQTHLLPPGSNCCPCCFLLQWITVGGCRSWVACSVLKAARPGRKRRPRTAVSTLLTLPACHTVAEHLLSPHDATAPTPLCLSLQPHLCSPDLLSFTFSFSLLFTLCLQCHLVTLQGVVSPWGLVYTVIAACSRSV